MGIQAIFYLLGGGLEGPDQGGSPTADIGIGWVLPPPSNSILYGLY